MEGNGTRPFMRNAEIMLPLAAKSARPLRRWGTSARPGARGSLWAALARHLGSGGSRRTPRPVYASGPGGPTFLRPPKRASRRRVCRREGVNIKEGWYYCALALRRGSSCAAGILPRRSTANSDKRANLASPWFDAWRSDAFGHWRSERSTRPFRHRESRTGDTVVILQPKVVIIR